MEESSLLAMYKIVAPLFVANAAHAFAESCRHAHVRQPQAPALGWGFFTVSRESALGVIVSEAETAAALAVATIAVATVG